MKRYHRLIPVAAVGLLLGCDVITNLFNPPKSGETGSSKLINFASQEEFADYFKQQLGQQNASLGDVFRGPVLEGADGASADAAAGSPPTAVDADGGGGGTGTDDHSTTTIQEEGVDESDVVKTDGTYLYLIEYANEGNQLRIVKAHPAAEAASSATVPLEGWGQDLYLYNNKVIAITSTGGGYFFLGGGIADGGVAVEIRKEVAPAGGASESGVADAEAGQDAGTSSSGEGTSDAIDGTGTDTPPDGVTSNETSADTDLIAPDIGVYRYERPRTVVTVVDVSNPAAPTVLSQTFFDGSQASSRMIDGVLHLVMANYQNYYFDIMPLLGRPEFSAESVDPTTVLPRYTRVNADGSTLEGDAVTWENLYRPTDPDGFGVVYVASVDVDADAAFHALGVVAEPGLIYSSRDALYLTDTNYDYTGSLRETTDVYKFAYANRGASARATGSVPGRILNQYSMSESDGYLRIATTVGPTFSFVDGQQTSESQNNVYVLGEADGALGITGRVENIAPGETIQAARFIGGRGYVVTFEQVDPLFTLDVSDPANPRIVGELKVPGFSTFLVPMDENHLLAVGQHVPPPDTAGSWGVQLSIFDVTDFANPVLMDNVVIGEEDGAYSEALYNPKALTYFGSRGLVALPISIYDFQTIVDPGVPVDDATASGGGSTGDAGDGSAVGAGTDSSTEIAPWIPPGFDGLFVYSATVEGGFSELGRISTRFEKEGYYWSSFTRGVFMGDDVLAVTDHGLRASAISSVSSPSVEVVWAEPVDFSPPVFIEEPLATDGTASSDVEADSSDGATGSPGAASGVTR